MAIVNIINHHDIVNLNYRKTSMRWLFLKNILRPYLLDIKIPFSLMRVASSSTIAQQTILKHHAIILPSYNFPLKKNVREPVRLSGLSPSIPSFDLIKFHVSRQQQQGDKITHDRANHSGSRFCFKRGPTSTRQDNRTPFFCLDIC